MRSTTPAAVRRIRQAVYADVRSPRDLYHRAIREALDGVSVVLDFGCGLSAPDLQQLDAGTARVGVDPLLCRQTANRDGLLLVAGSGVGLPFRSQSFDLVISRSVLEHLETPDAVFVEINRVLRPRGHFIFLTPNAWDYVSLMGKIVPYQWHPMLVEGLTGRTEADTFPTFYRANTLGRLRALARQAGFTVVDLTLLREHPHYLQRSTLAYCAGVAYETTVQRWLTRLRPWILGKVQRAERPA